MNVDRGVTVNNSHSKRLLDFYSTQRALNGLIQVKDNEKRKGCQAGRASHRFLEISNPALYYSQVKTGLRQLDLCQFSFQNDCSEDQ